MYVNKDQDAADAGGKPMHTLNMSNITRSFVNGIVVAMGQDAKPKSIIINKKQAHKMVNAKQRLAVARHAQIESINAHARTTII